MITAPPPLPRSMRAQKMILFLKYMDDHWLECFAPYRQGPDTPRNNVEANQQFTKRMYTIV